VLATFIPSFPIYPPETSWPREPRTSVPGLIVQTPRHDCRIAYLPAVWFLTRATKRGNTTHACANGTPSTQDDRPVAESNIEMQWPDTDLPDDESPLEAQRGSAALSLATTQTLAASTV
jgi:hypothetical protein